MIEVVGGKNMKKIAGFLVGIIIVIPLTINFIGNKFVLSSEGEYGEWLSFWGSYLGGIIGMFAVLSTTFFLINNQNKHHHEQLNKQSEQHLQLLYNQNIQHQEQLEEQRKTIEENDIRERDRMHLEIKMKYYDEVYELLVGYQTLFIEFHNTVTELAVLKAVNDGGIQIDSYNKKTLSELYTETLNYRLKVQSLSLNVGYYMFTGKNSKILDMGNFLDVSKGYENCLVQTVKAITSEKMDYEIQFIDKLMEESNKNKDIFQTKYHSIISDIALFKTRELNEITSVKQ